MFKSERGIIMDFLTLAKERFSCRKFSEKQVEQEKIDKIIQAGLYSPTAVNKQPFKIFEIQSEEGINKLKNATPFTFDASVFLAVGADKRIAYQRNFDNKDFSEIDATIVSTHIMLEIQNLGLGTTWVGHFDEAVLKSEFPQMKDYSIVAIFPIGYPADDVQINPLHYQSKTKEEVLELI